MKIRKDGSTIRQQAYARRVWSAQGTSKKQIALDVGYAPGSANSVMTKIENKRGFQNAMSKLASESNSLALEVLSEFKARGLKEFSNSELTNALNAIGNAWSKFNAPMIKDPNKDGQGGNKLRTIIMQRVENQVIQALPVEEEVTNQKEHEPEDESDADEGGIEGTAPDADRA